MQVEFHDDYMLFAVAAVALVVFCRPVTDCARFLCTLFVVPAELRECAHCERVASRAREVLCAVLLVYSSLQPLWFWLASRAVWFYRLWDARAQREAGGASNSTQVACVLSAALYANRTAAARGVLALDRSSSRLLQVDGLLVAMPFAIASALCTAAWKHLCDVNVFIPADRWDTDLFAEESRVWEYEMLFQLELASMLVATLCLGSVGISFETALFAAAALCSFQVFFAAAARESRKAPAASFIMSLATVVFCLVLLHLAVSYVDWRSPPRAVCAVCGLAAHFVIATGHQVAAGESSVASVISLRVLPTAAASVSVLVLLALRTCAAHA